MITIVEAPANLARFRSRWLNSFCGCGCGPGAAVVAREVRNFEPGVDPDSALTYGALQVGTRDDLVTALSLTSFSGMVDDEKTGDAGTGGEFTAVVARVAFGLVLALPKFSATLLGVAGLISFTTAATGYGNYWFYGSVFIAVGTKAARPCD